jgi:hypothetical protein
MRRFYDSLDFKCLGAYFGRNIAETILTKNQMLKKSIYYIAILSAILGSIAAAKAQQLFIADVSSLQTNASVQSVARGFCTLRFNQSETQGELTCRYINFFGNFGDVITLNIHGNAGVGEDAPVILNFQIPVINPSGVFTRTFNVSAGQFTELRANKNYIVMAQSPGTVIRGQIHLANSAYNDFDGDGRTDLTVYRNGNNTFYAKSSLTGEVIQQTIGQAGDSVSLTVDFDGDGRSDFSTARYSSQVLWRIFSSATGTLQETQWGSSTLGDFFAAADYDGDGRADIAVFRAGIWYIIESSTGNYRYEYFGQAGDVPAPNDFDKDGKADLAVARSENGQRVWYVRQSSNNQFYAVQWGLSSDAFFTGRADWDGDGATDISVIRNESGQRVFYIRRSSDNQLQIIRWGLTSDLVKLGDYDGDGKTDAAVTRTVDGLKVFLILRSSNNQPRYEYFGSPSDF